VEQCCVLGSGQPAPCAVLNLADGAISDSELEALLTRVNAQLEKHERLKFLAVLHTPWTIASGHLTPSLKIRRGAIEQGVAAQLDEWYASGAAVLRH
jgi:long-chain acyl-CoA synthetase